jgi:phosphoglycerate kinase
MAKLAVDKLNVKGKKVLVRVDFNVPLDENLKVTDDMRIVETLPTIKNIIERGGTAILMSHLGRPKGKIVDSMRLTPAAKRLSELIGKEVKMAPDCIGPEVEKMVSQLKPGDILMLDNLRFHPEEEKNDPEFSRKLASFGEVYVNDAFGTAHRAHASTVGVTEYFKGKCAAGFLIEKELKYLGDALTNPKRPFVAILGGAKVSSKIGVIENLFNKVDRLLIGGGMTFTFYKAQGFEVGKSLLEEETIEDAKKILQMAKEKKVDFVLPIDCVVATEIKEDAETKVVDVKSIPSDMMGVDIGPKTLELFSSKLKDAKTIVWNGPVGVFEIDKFAKGTNTIANLLAKLDAITIIGGGDSASAINKAGVADKMTHISTGGGASLEFLEGIELPGIKAMTDI